MSEYGFRTRNNNGTLTIDSNLFAYIYLGAYVIPSQAGTYQTVNFTCSGFPLVFFDVPYNMTAGEVGAFDSVDRYMSRCGIAMIKLVSTGASSWQATFIVSNNNGPDLGLYMRVFGKSHLNAIPSTNTHGLRVRNTAGNVVFDSDMPMLRLGVSTYDAEIRLDPLVPGMTSTTKDAALFDNWVDVGTNMSGMSVWACARGMVNYPFNVGNGYYDVHKFVSLYWANDNRLYARRISVGYDHIYSPSGYPGNASEFQVVYSRVSVLRNEHWPTLPNSGVAGAPLITTQPLDTATITDGNTATFSLVATGNATLVYVWRRNGVIISGAATNTYSFTVGTGNNTGDEYKCTVSNSIGVVTSRAAKLTVQHLNPGPAPTISSPPGSLSVYQNTAASMSVIASPVDGYQWYKGGTLISGATGASLNLSTSVLGTFTYMVRCYNNGLYSDATATLTVSVDNSPPTIETAPTSLTVTQNGSAYFSVTANPVTAYQWYRNGVAISGATTSAIFADTANIGTFTLVVRCFNGANYSDASCTLTVNAPSGGGGGAPVITTHPVSATVEVGDILNLSCAASPVTGYQWYRNNLPITSAVNSVLNVYTGEVGTSNYYCIISNGSLTSTTNTAVVTVNVAAGSGTPYNNYQNILYYESTQYDVEIPYNITAADPWHVGVGDFTLYDVMASPVGSTDALSPLYQSFNVWYSFAEYSNVTWMLKRPVSTVIGHSTLTTFVVSVRLRSTGEVVSSGSARLESINSETAP